MTIISAVVDPDGTGTLTVQRDGQTVRAGIDSVSRAVELMGLLIACEQGDRAACAELDARGVQPPMLDLDPDPIAGGRPCR